MTIKRFVSLILALTLLISSGIVPVHAQGSIFIYEPQCEAGESVRIEWDPWEGEDVWRYHFSAADITEEDSGNKIQIYEHKELKRGTTHKNINGDWIEAGHTYRVWVGAYNEDEEILAQGLLVFVCEEKNCSHRQLGYYWVETKTESIGGKTYRVEYYDVVCESCGEIIDTEKISVSETEVPASAPSHSCIHNNMTEVSRRRSTLVNESTDCHSYQLTILYRCECGHEEEIVEKTYEEHCFQGEGIEAEHIAGKGHRTYSRCECGAALYTGYAPLEGCSACKRGSTTTAVSTPTPTSKPVSTPTPTSSPKSVSTPSAVSQSEKSNNVNAVDFAAAVNEIEDFPTRKSSHYNTLTKAILAEQTTDTAQVIRETLISLGERASFSSVKEGLRKQILIDYLTAGTNEADAYFLAFFLGSDNLSAYEAYLDRIGTGVETCQDYYKFLVSLPKSKLKNVKILDGIEYCTTAYDVGAILFVLCDEISKANAFTTNERTLLMAYASKQVTAWWRLEELKPYLTEDFRKSAEELQDELLAEEFMDTLNAVNLKSGQKRNAAINKFFGKVALVLTANKLEQAGDLAKEYLTALAKQSETQTITDVSMNVATNTATAAFADFFSICTSLYAGLEIGQALAPRTLRLIKGKQTMILMVPIQLELTECLRKVSGEYNQAMLGRLCCCARLLAIDNAIEAMGSINEETNSYLVKERSQVNKLMEQLDS